MKRESFAAGMRAAVPVVLGYLGIGIAPGIQLAAPGPAAVIGATVLGATLGLSLERWKSGPKSSR